MEQQISRRSFLKGGMAAAAGVAAAGIPGSKALAGPDESKQLATLIDISKCVGCEACVDACSEANSEQGSQTDESKFSTQPGDQPTPSLALPDDDFFSGADRIWSDADFQTLLYCRHSRTGLAG